MGYCIEQTDSRFAIRAEHFPSAVRDLFAAHPYYSEHGLELKQRATEIMADPSIVESYHPAKALEVLFDMGFLRPQFADSGIVGVDFRGDKAGGGEEEVFVAVAPYVERNSFVEFTGEDRCVYRYLFFGGEVGKIEPFETAIRWPKHFRPLRAPKSIMDARAAKPKRKARK